MAAYPLLLPQAADPGFVAHVAALMTASAHLFRPNNADPERRKVLNFDDGFDPRLSDKKHEMAASLALTDWIIDPRFGNFIGCISEGGTVHAHKDPAAEGRMHLRINLLIAKPEGGGVPLLDGMPVAVEEGDAWLCFASECRHSSTPVEGPRVRSVLSYGLQVTRQSAFPHFARYLHWRTNAGG